MESVRFTGDVERLVSFISGPRLAYARYETALSQKFFALLDLVFADGDRIALVPWLVVDGMMLLEREYSPFIWPAHLRSLADDVVDDIEARIEPWLRSLVIARCENGAGERFFSHDSAFCGRVARAKEEGWLGATSAPSVLRDIAPHAYAARFSAERDVFVSGPGAANGAAFLAATSRVRAKLADGATAEAACIWFDLPVFSAGDVPAHDLYVGPRSAGATVETAIVLDAEPLPGERGIPLATPLPIEILVSFDLDDAPEAGRFAVRHSTRSARVSRVVTPAPTGGSSGRIALVAREDVLRVQDADSDAVSSLAAMLRDEGFSAEIVAPSHFRAERYDFVHVFGHRFARAIAPEVRAAAAAAIPIALTPYADDPQGEYVTGGAILRKLLQSCDDEGSRFEYLEALARRRLRDDDRPVEDEEATRELFAAAGVAFVTCPREDARIRSDFGFSGRTVMMPAIASSTNGAADVTWATGYADFALVTGAIAPAGNAYLVARAAASLGMPLVVCGHVTDAAYYTELRSVLGRTGIWLPAEVLGADGVRALLARARVVADASWSGHGLHRLATAICTGGSVVGSTAGYAGDVWAEAVPLADPASEASIAAALERAWNIDEAARLALLGRTVPIADPLAALVATVAGYQEAARAPDGALTQPS